MTIPAYAESDTVAATVGACLVSRQQAWGTQLGRLASVYLRRAAVLRREASVRNGAPAQPLAREGARSAPQA